ncbi:type IX secretion system outer membrane channel protein PorV [Flavobacteriaceae bacterium F08102]|nr:type IX secretion system outer membrane channel protein PorV [Flavobacteriaceae bacterium F08102]
MKKPLILLLALVCFIKTNAQENPNPITTAAPFLLIAPDARSGGMGDIGVATAPDANSQHFNPAKFAFAEYQYSIGVNYTPWLRNLTNDVFVSSVGFANRIDDRSAWATSLKFFSLGTIDLTDNSANPIGTENPNELSIDGSYSLKLNETFAMAVAVRYIRSDFALRVENSDLKTVNTFAVDIAGYYESEEKNYGNFNGLWRGGFNLSNIGPKVTLTEGGSESFIPTNMKLGGGFDFILDNFNRVSANIEVNKLLVPTPPLRDQSTGEIIEGKDNNVGFLGGMFQSFGDAPNGFSEELKEFTWALGAEYSYDNTVAFRAGYFNESDLKGARKYFTLGAGAKFRSLNLDVSYLINSSDVNNPLENTLRFSLTFNFGDVFGY